MSNNPKALSLSSPHRDEKVKGDVKNKWYYFLINGGKQNLALVKNHDCVQKFGTFTVILQPRMRLTHPSLFGFLLHITLKSHNILFLEQQKIKCYTEINESIRSVIQLWWHIFVSNGLKLPYNKYVNRHKVIVSELNRHCDVELTRTRRQTTKHNKTTPCTKLQPNDIICSSEAAYCCLTTELMWKARKCECVTIRCDQQLVSGRTIEVNLLFKEDLIPV